MKVGDFVNIEYVTALSIGMGENRTVEIIDICKTCKKVWFMLNGERTCVRFKDLE